MRLLDRYIISSFLIPFSLCFFGFLAIWFVFDFAGNVQDFVDARVSAGFIVFFYLTQIPQFAVLCLPVGLLLSLLFATTKMSRSNEIIAMLTAGQSLWRVMLPLVGAGVVKKTGKSYQGIKQGLAALSARMKEFHDKIVRP